MNISLHTLSVAVLLAPLVALAHGTAGSQAGRPGAASLATRIVKIGMQDAMRFDPARLLVAHGETVIIEARNDGQVLHEIVLGTRDEIARHRQAMQSDPDMQHGAPNMAHVAPGASERIVWQFDRAGTFEYACLLPGHYEAGMNGTVVVRNP